MKKAEKVKRNKCAQGETFIFKLFGAYARNENLRLRGYRKKKCPLRFKSTPYTI